MHFYSIIAETDQAKGTKNPLFIFSSHDAQNVNQFVKLLSMMFVFHKNRPLSNRVHHKRLINVRNVKGNNKVPRMQRVLYEKVYEVSTN